MKQNKEHHFKTDEAEKYGIEKAVILYNIRFWLDKNKANKSNIKEHEGRKYYWTFNSSKAFSELFPYMKASSISRWLRELEEDGTLISGKFNKVNYDRTKWYTIDEYSIDQNEQSIAQNERPIPDSKPQIVNTDIPAKAVPPPFDFIVELEKLGNSTWVVDKIIYNYWKKKGFGFQMASSSSRLVQGNSAPQKP